MQRAVYMLKSGIDIGPPRPPSLAFKQSDMDALRAALTKYGFFNQTNPATCLPNTWPLEEL
jgi:hypothetical protein